MNAQTSSRDARSWREADACGMRPTLVSADAEQVPQAEREVLDQVAQRGRDRNRDCNRTEAGKCEEDEWPDPDLPGRKPRNTFRVDEDLADLEPCDESRRHAGAVPFEEFDQVEVRAHGDDQLGAFLVCEQQRQVLADPCRRNDLVRHAELSWTLGSRFNIVSVAVDEK